MTATKMAVDTEKEFISIIIDCFYIQEMVSASYTNLLSRECCFWCFNLGKVDDQNVKDERIQYRNFMNNQTTDEETMINMMFLQSIDRKTTCESSSTASLEVIAR
jgi:hypothetical protein